MEKRGWIPSLISTPHLTPYPNPTPQYTSSPHPQHYFHHCFSTLPSISSSYFSHPLPTLILLFPFHTHPSTSQMYSTPQFHNPTLSTTCPYSSLLLPPTHSYSFHTQSLSCESLNYNHNLATQPFLSYPEHFSCYNPNIQTPLYHCTSIHHPTSTCSHFNHILLLSYSYIPYLPYHMLTGCCGEGEEPSQDFCKVTLANPGPS